MIEGHSYRLIDKDRLLSNDGGCKCEECVRVQVKDLRTEELLEVRFSWINHLSTGDKFIFSYEHRCEKIEIVTLDLEL